MSGVPRGLRACLVCAFVQPGSKFSKNGCPNCEHFLELRHSSDAVADCTSEVFEGLVTVSDTKQGWVSKWLRIQGYEAGIYATKVNGLVSTFSEMHAMGGEGRVLIVGVQLPEEYAAAAENAGIRYIP